MPRLREHERLYVRSMGKEFRVTAVFTSDDDMNGYLTKHRDEGVIASVGGVSFAANLYQANPELED